MTDDIKDLVDNVLYTMTIAEALLKKKCRSCGKSVTEKDLPSPKQKEAYFTYALCKTCSGVG